MKRLLFAPAVAVSLAGITHAQSVEFRIVERQGQVGVPIPLGVTPTTDNVLNFAVQARVIDGTPTQFLGSFGFDIVASSEPSVVGTHGEPAPVPGVSSLPYCIWLAHVESSVNAHAHSI